MWKSILSKLAVLGELFSFLWKNKRWWIIPVVVLLLVFAIIFVIAESSALGPFIYPLI